MLSYQIQAIKTSRRISPVNLEFIHVQWHSSWFHSILTSASLSKAGEWHPQKGRQAFARCDDHVVIFMLHARNLNKVTQHCNFEGEILFAAPGEVVVPTGGPSATIKDENEDPRKGNTSHNTITSQTAILKQI
jgi:hypothetical protein